MINILLVGIGGFFGSVSRYIISGMVYNIVDRSLFPLGTLAVNVFGCLIIGFLNGISESHHLFNPEIRNLVFIGFLGGFTTFSTFGYEVFSFAHEGQIFSSALNILLHLILGFGSVWLGYIFSKLF